MNYIIEYIKPICINLYLETLGIKTYIITIFFFVCKVTFGGVAIKTIIHKGDSLLETDSYTVYKLDTFNIRDSNGKIQGKGLYALKDSTIQIISSHTLGYHNGSKVATCTHHEEISIYYTVKEVFYGQYQDNLKTGVWTCIANKGKRKVEINYNNDIIQGQVNIYFETGELMYSGIAVGGQDEIDLKKFTKSGIEIGTIKWWLSDITELDF